MNEWIYVYMIVFLIICWFHMSCLLPLLPNNLSMAFQSLIAPRRLSSNLLLLPPILPSDTAVEEVSSSSAAIPCSRFNRAL
jgi:hypothetical protein